MRWTAGFSRGFRAIALPALILAVAVSAVAALSRGAEAPRTGSQAPSPEPVPAAPPLPDTVPTVRPSLKVSVSGGVSPETIQQIRGVAGVQGAARVLLSNLTIRAPGGETGITIAGVDPEEFRPLTPEATAQARFVWEGLHQSKLFLAHEEYQILGGEPVSTLIAEMPRGEHVLRVGGLATSGVPSLAGAMMSMRQAEELELGSPTMLLVGLAEGADLNATLEGLRRVLPDAKIENMVPPAGRTFYSGAAAQKAIGTFTFTTNADGTINQNQKWVREHLASARMPIIGGVRCHELMLPQLRLALEEIQSSGLSHLIKPAQTGRCYQPRYVNRDPAHQLSKHAWGLAIDLNVYDNPEGSKPKMDPRIVEIFEKWGFRWGGRWTIPDGMHFELAALLKE